MARILYVLFFASGLSALIFEMLWFRQAGLALGNSVWASSLVLSGFMGGLALGNAAAARYGTRIANPVRAYAIAELTIAVTGVGLVYTLPMLGAALAPWMRPLLDQPSLLNPIRLLIAFVLLLVPATAMGVTLPLVTGALAKRRADFGSVLGQLYGWNTLGAVAGVVLVETYLVEAHGVVGTALIAGGLNAAAALVALWVASHEEPRPSLLSGTGSVQATEATPKTLLVAAFVSGFCLLALEVVWFRFLLLFVKGHALALALMLALVLAGIALGGLAASIWLRRNHGIQRSVPWLALAAAAACVASYAMAPGIVESMPSLVVNGVDIVRVTAPITFPVSFLSGLFFTSLGAALRVHLAGETQTTGILTLMNTSGAAAGALIGGLALLPWLGVEKSWFVIALLYGGMGVLLMAASRRRMAAWVGAVVFLAVVVLFPFGSLEGRVLQRSVARWLQAGEDARIVAVREGLTETIVYFQRLMLGRPVSYAMLTNAYSMSATGYGARRYMKLYVYWPIAVHPNLKRALLIGYGVGNTAKALTDSAQLETIDIVDLSRDILDLNRIVYADEADLPLRDPRVRVHVEDGRYLLQATSERFDLITGEPPPPGIAGVEHLYTREYFQLIHERLADGGITTYWLPLSDLSDVSARAILGAFCDVFDDCSLWNGSGTHLMLIGTRGARGGVSEAAFSTQWDQPVVADEMRRIGLERPEQLGALFIGDRRYVAPLVGDARSLTDNSPKLIEAPSSSAQASEHLVRSVTDVAAARARFETSPLIRRLWPEHLLTASLPYFEFQDVINSHMYGNLMQRTNAIEDVHRVLTASSLAAPVLWRLGSNSDIQRLIDDAPPDRLADPALQFHLGVRRLSERRYVEAADALSRAEMLTDRADGGVASTGDNAFALHVYALCMAGEVARAQELIREPWLQSLRNQGVSADAMKDAPLPPFWVWMKTTFGIDPRAQATVR